VHWRFVVIEQNKIVALAMVSAFWLFLTILENIRHFQKFQNKQGIFSNWNYYFLDIFFPVS